VSRRKRREAYAKLDEDYAQLKLDSDVFSDTLEEDEKIEMEEVAVDPVGDKLPTFSSATELRQPTDYATHPDVMRKLLHGDESDEEDLNSRSKGKGKGKGKMYAKPSEPIDIPTDTKEKARSQSNSCEESDDKHDTGGGVGGHSGSPVLLVNLVGSTEVASGSTVLSS